MNNLALVTGLWNIKRDQLTEGWSRSYEDHYLKKFDQLLQIDANLIVFGDKELESFVFQRRNQNKKILHVLSFCKSFPTKSEFCAKSCQWFMY